jgi:hypothetical protein
MTAVSCFEFVVIDGASIFKLVDDDDISHTDVQNPLNDRAAYPKVAVPAHNAQKSPWSPIALVLYTVEQKD